MLKAFKVFPGEHPSDHGCMLVFAENYYKSRSLGCSGWPGSEPTNYRDFKSWRVPNWDKYAHELDCPTCFDYKIPEHWEPFFDNSEV